MANTDSAPYICFVPETARAEGNTDFLRLAINLVIRNHWHTTDSTPGEDIETGLWEPVFHAGFLLTNRVLRANIVVSIGCG